MITTRAPDGANNEQTKSMHKITILICLQLFACKLANIRKPVSKKDTQIQGMTYSPRSAAIQVQTVMLWMTTMSIQGKMRIATIFNSGSGSELFKHHWRWKREGRQSGSRSWSVSMACPGLLDIDCVSHVTCVRLTHASYQSTEDNFP